MQSLLPLPSFLALYLSDAAMTTVSLGQANRASLSLPLPHNSFHSDLPSSKSLGPGYKEGSGLRIQLAWVFISAVLLTYWVTYWASYLTFLSLFSQIKDENNKNNLEICTSIRKSGHHLPGIQWSLTDAISLPFLLVPISSRVKM